MAVLEFELVPKGPYSLEASSRFLEGFTPADYQGGGDGLQLAFPVEGDWRTAAVSVRQRSDGVVTVAADSAAPLELVREQVARILSLDVDGSEFAAIGERDPVAADLMRRYRGLRPVCFHSAYEAACWAIIGNRIRMAQAAALKTTIARRFGEQVSVNGVSLAAFPSPRRLADAGELPGLSQVKQDRLRSVAAAAMDGTLLSRNLREQSAQGALTAVQRIPGIGPFSAELILVRGAGAPDWFPGSESRLHDSMARAYGVAADDLPALTEIAGKWAPFRSWVSVLLRVHREELPIELSA